MDAVELPFPVDVAAAPKLMGSEAGGFLRAGFSVKEVGARPSWPESVSVIVNHSIECCSSRLIENDVTNMKNDAEFTSGNEFRETQLCKNSSQLPHHDEEVSKIVPCKGKSCPGIQGVTLQQKAAKVNKGNSSCSKRPRLSQTEDSTFLKGVEESKDISDKLGSYHIKTISSEKSQLPKQKGYATKRSDKRNLKMPSSKAKFESSSSKMGAAILSSSTGGLYGLKNNIHDVSKLINEPPLDELLRGTFDWASLSKDKEKKASNTSESFLNSVRKACSMLQVPKYVQSPNVAEMDSSSNKKLSACQLSFCNVENFSNGDKEHSGTSDISSCRKDPYSETESPTSPLDSPLCQPKDVLEQIALPPPQDLESLLLDASKLAITTKSSNNLRSGKQVSRQPSLPAFPWSHAFGGHSRVNSEMVKLSTSRTTCPGKWARIGAIASSTDTDCGCFTSLDSLSYDQSLVPSSGSSDNKVFTSLCTSLPFCQRDSSSSVTCSKDSQATAEFGGQVDTKDDDGHCPRLLAAAQTLYEIATHSLRGNPDGIVRWQKKAPQKTMKAYDCKSTERLKEMPSKPISVSGSDLASRSAEQIIPSKKPRLSIVENNNSGHSNNVKRPCTWPTSKSSRSLPSRLVRDSVVENKHSTESILKQHCMMPPPDRVSSKPHDGQRNVGKLVLMDWKRGRDK